MFLSRLYNFYKINLLHFFYIVLKNILSINIVVYKQDLLHYLAKVLQLANISINYINYKLILKLVSREFFFYYYFLASFIVI